MSEFKGTKYYKNNCEENYITTPISVLRYISVLETERDEMLEMLKDIYINGELTSNKHQEIYKLLTKITN